MELAMDEPGIRRLDEAVTEGMERFMDRISFIQSRKHWRMRNQKFTIFLVAKPTIFGTKEYWDSRGMGSDVTLTARKIWNVNWRVEKYKASEYFPT